MYLTLGFDAKAAIVSSWDKNRKNIFLLNKNCNFPKSVDDSVWSSVFDSNENQKQINTIFQGYHANLSELEQACVEPNKIIVSIALELESCSDSDLLEWRRRLFGGQKENLLDDGINIPSVCEPSIIPSEFKCIGYDIADSWGLSGLMNCAIDEIEIGDSKAKEFAPFLNEHHLFEDFSKANKYALCLNEIVKEHAPFFVYSLWER